MKALMISLTVLLLIIPSSLFAFVAPTIDVFLLPNQSVMNTSRLAVQSCTLQSLNATVAAINESIEELNNQSLAETVILSQSPAINAAYQCAIKAKRLGIQHLPAIVLNNHYIVYGSTNVDEAISDYLVKQGLS